MTRTTDSAATAIDMLEVLVIADEAIAQLIARRLKKEMTVTTLSPPPGLESDFAWLVDALFLFPNDKTGSLLNEPTMLFSWSRFDAVVIQDVWLSGSGTDRQIEFAGRICALWDSNRGNLDTRKVVLSSEQSSLVDAVRAWTPAGGSPITLADIQRALDPTHSVHMIDMARAGYLNDIYQSIINPHGAHANTAMSESEANDVNESIVQATDMLVKSVMRGAATAIRSSIGKNATILIIDDEPAAAARSYKAVTGAELRSTFSIGTIAVLHAADGMVSICASFEQVREQCICALTQQSTRRDACRDVLIVTDILFDKAHCNETGITLIQELRRQRLGSLSIVALTGFTSPFLTMAAYLHGADYVIHKNVAPGVHDSLRVTADDRLLEALSTICFQRRFLRDLRRKCGDVLNGRSRSADVVVSAAIRMSRLLLRTLPRQTVSLHLQQEWSDTYYLMSLLQMHGITGSALSQARTLLRELEAKY